MSTSDRKKYWDKISPTTEGMVQIENAEVVAHVDTAEILQYLPEYKGKRVLDLGAGIGRFTTKLAQVAEHVTAMDISQTFINHNKTNNKHLNNISYICKDVTELDFPDGSFHLVFSSWILKYLNDEEISQLLSRILKWLTPGGHFFFRESCFHISGTIYHTGNPTIFRSPLHYCELLHSVSQQNVKFKLLRGKNVQSYLQFQAAPNQVCFLAGRVDQDQKCELNKLLETRYSLQNITMMEKICGSQWVSIGRADTAKELYDELPLRPRQRVLDIGCGTGSSTFFIAEHYRCQVLGVDHSVAAINFALERQLKLDKDLRRLVQFEIGDILNKDFEEGVFDVIYSRECFIYVPNKKQLFSKIHKWLRPGGTVFFSDILKGSSPPSQVVLDFLETIKPCSPVTLDSYKREMIEAGFRNVSSMDYAKQWRTILQKDIQIFDSTRPYFVEDMIFHDHVCNISKKKMEWIKDEQITWGVFSANK